MNYYVQHIQVSKDIFCVGRITLPIFDFSDDFNQLSRVDMLRSHHSAIVNTSVETLLYYSRDDMISVMRA